MVKGQVSNKSGGSSIPQGQALLEFKSVTRPFKGRSSTVVQAVQLGLGTAAETAGRRVR